MAVTAARLAFLFDVRDFTACRHLTIPPDDTSARERGEAEKPNETHGTLPKPTLANEVPLASAVWRGEIARSRVGWVTHYHLQGRTSQSIHTFRPADRMSV
jgi:hypothetical protein